ncbi:cytoplasmic protein [Xenorhabdus beddingii]|uniref:Cytoplasmic protein n=1 Tax=Xenorhabdus beddingii TaxID=40578 RepID=A0A1Y2SPB9_9GAMM|nr:cytoplasmic protein [Xenorhabdus beddingii]
MKASRETAVRVSGSGDSRQKAIADALNAVQRTVLQGSSHIILRIEPKDVAIVSATRQVTTEKFLFFFLPRQREHYSVVLDVTVNVTLLDVESIHFETTHFKTVHFKPIRVTPQKNPIPAEQDKEEK